MRRSDPPPSQPPDEFEQFVAARSGQLYRSAYLLTGSASAAEDLTQAALAKTFAAWRRVSRADDPVAYVHGVLTKTFLSERRRRSSTELPVERVPESAVHDPDPAERLVLLAALAHLNRVDRAVVVMRFWEDRSVADTARQLGLSEAAVKNRSLRALRSLRGLLGEPAHASDQPGSPR